MPDIRLTGERLIRAAVTHAMNKGEGDGDDWLKKDIAAYREATSALKGVRS